MYALNGGSVFVSDSLFVCRVALVQLILQNPGPLLQDADLGSQALDGIFVFLHGWEKRTKVGEIPRNINISVLHVHTD